MTIPHRSYRRARIYKRIGCLEPPRKHDANSIVKTAVPPSTLADDLEPRSSIRIRTHTLTTCTLLPLCPVNRASIIATRFCPIYPDCAFRVKHSPPYSVACYALGGPHPGRRQTSRPVLYHDITQKHRFSHHRLGDEVPPLNKRLRNGTDTRTQRGVPAVTWDRSHAHSLVYPPAQHMLR